MIQDSTGGLIFLGKRLALDPPVLPGLKAAAYYEGTDTLVAVEPGGAVSLYESGTLKRRDEREYEARVLRVLFTRIAGVLYPLCLDVRADESLRRDPRSQDYATKYHRLVLCDSDDEWHGTSQKEGSALLQVAYRITSRGFDLSRSPAEWITVVLPEPLGSPFRSGPSDPLAEAVFLFGDQGMVCRTKHGWSVHKADGALVRWFSDKGIQVGWWVNPTFEDGLFYLNARTGPGGRRYRMNLATGRLE